MPPRAAGLLCAAAALSAAVRGEEREVGCGEAFLLRFSEYCRASGCQLAPKEGPWTKRELFEHTREVCVTADGCFAKVQVDLLGYASRRAAEAEGREQSAMQEIRDFFAARLTPQDIAELSGGFAFCVPTSCRGQPEMMPIFLRMYIFTVAAMQDDPQFAAPEAGTEINSTFVGEGLCTAEVPADPLTAAALCVEEARNSADETGAPYGVAFIPRSACDGAAHIVEVSRKNMKMCVRRGGMMRLVQFDSHAYAARKESEDAARWDPNVGKALARVRDFAETVSLEVARDFVHGFGLCLPTSCSAAVRSGLGRVVLDLLVTVASAVPGFHSLNADHLPDPRWGVDMNVSDWAAAVGHTACAPASDAQAAAAGSPQGAGADEASEDAEETPGVLNGTGFQVPWWYGCEGSSIDSEWAAFGRLMRAEFVRGAKGPVSGALAEAADLLVKKYWKFAMTWGYWVSRYTERTCDKEYTHIMDLSAHVEFSPALFMLAGGKRMSDTRWWRMGSWTEAMAFCPYGFMAALYVRARTFRAAGARASAVRDLTLGRQMLGGCGEMDLLDVHVWGVRALDVELNLLREELADLHPEAFGSSCSTADPGCSEGAAGGSDGYLEPRDLADIWPARLHDWRPFAWHALQLNTIVRLWTRQAAARQAARGDGSLSSPRLLLLTFPLYLCLFLVPMLLRVWGAGLQLSLFFVGRRWTLHEKCSACMADYGRRFVVETPFLQELPLKLSGVETEGKTTMYIDWTLEMTHQELLSLLRDFVERQARARAADVFLCTAPLWLCTSLRMVSLKPFIALDLPNPDLGAPPGLRDPGNSNDARAQRHILRMAFRHFVRDLPAGPPLRALLVREDMWRSYHDVEMMLTGTAFPFVAAPSIYIDARYSCRERSDVLVMREGSQYRWAPSFRGRLFFATLRQFETRASPWRFRIMHDTKVRLDYQQLADHRAALWIQLSLASKITLKDLLTMEIPVFVPGEALQSSISGRVGFHGCRKHGRGTVSWAYTLCREVKYPMSRLQLSPLFRNPHLQHFESITDLVRQLAGQGCEDLRAISARMRRWNEALVADDVDFWRNAILALAAWDAADSAGPRGPADSGPAAAGAPAVGDPAVPAQVPAFRFPVGPPGWVPAGGQASEPCGLLAAHCPIEAAMPDDHKAESRAQGEWRTGPYECCASAYALEHGPFGPNSSWAAGNNASLTGGCLEEISQCDENLLRYGMHLLHELPPLDGS